MKKQNYGIVLSAWLTLFSIVIGMLSGAVYAVNDTTESGKSTDSIAWAYADGTLTISGTGAMEDYNGQDGRPPWDTYKDQIEYISIEDGITKVGNFSFYKIGEAYSALKSVSLPGSLTEIGNSSFRESGLEYVIIPDSVVKLGTYVFSGCTSLESVTLSEKIKIIPEKTFEKCENLKTINLPNGLETIECFAFDGCTSLSSINFPDSLKQLNNESFKNTGFTEITIPNTLTELGGTKSSDGTAVSGPFADCAALTKVVYAQGVTSLGKSNPFYSCKSLREVVIPGTVTTLGNKPFAQCSNLRVVFYGGSEQEWKKIYTKKLVATKEPYTVIYNFSQDETGNLPAITTNLSDTTVFQNDSVNLRITTAPADMAATYIYHWFEADQADGSDSRWKSSEVINVQTGESAESVLPLTTSDLGTKYYYCEVSAVQDGKRGTVNSAVAKVTVQEGGASLTGEGTENNPYLLTNAADLATLRNMVNNGISMDGCYLRVENDIELGSDWTPIGTLKTGVSGADWGRNIIPFMGILDGNNHTITFSSGSKPLFGYVREAAIRNLNISAPYMDGAGLVNNYAVDYGSDGVSGTGIPKTVEIENVTIKSNSKIKGSGFIGGDGGSGSNSITISNCSIEENVIIGCDVSGNPLANDSIGSFAGDFNGLIRNSVSSATVYGRNYVGGLVGRKGQSMGGCTVVNSSFSGSIKASGEYVGGIIGSGYYGNSTAPNTPCVNIQNCYVKGSIIGGNKVGGILGGEAGCLQAWENGKGRIQDNHFYGTVSATDQGGIRGGIIGFLPSLNAHNAIENNYYLNEDGLKGIGKVLVVDTSLHSDGTSTPAGLVGEVYYMNTAEDDKWTIRNWLVENNLYIPDPNNPTSSPLHSEYITNRTDDPLGKDADKLTTSALEKDFSSPTGVLGKLNGSSSSLHNWILEENGKYPVHSNQAVPYKIEISGNYKDSCFVGDSLDLSGIEFTVTWSDNTITHPTLVPATGAVDGVEYVQISGFDSSSRKVLTLTASFQSIQTTFKYTIKDKTGSPITISFALLGDNVHPVSSSNTHTLSGGGLSRWIPSSGPDEFVTYSFDNNATVKDVVEHFVGKDNISNPDGNYIKSITWNDITLAEFSNGANSGWMYTLNGIHSELGVSEQFLNDGDKIIFHYTDDYTKEKNITTIPDRSSLLKLIAQAEALNEADYTPESWAILQSVLGEARKTAENEGAPSAEIEAMQNSLTAAIEALQRVQLPGFRQALKDTLAYIAQTVPAPAFGTTSGEWSVLALARGGYDPGAGYFDEYYDRIMETVKAAPNAPKLHAQKSTDNSRLILALSAIGRDPRKVGGVNLLAAFTDMDWVEYQGVNGPIFALLALDSGKYPEPGTNTRQALVDRIVSRQLSSGGFPINPGGDVDLDMTGMALQALAPYKAQANVSQAIDRALAYLSSVQNQNGGFGNNSEVNVQAIVALSALGIDAKTDARFVKPGGDPVTALLNYAADGGGFKHLMSQTSANAMATDQAAYALVAYTRFLDGKNRLYDMTDVEPAAAGTVEVTVKPEVNGDTSIAAPDLNKALETAKAEDKDIILATVTDQQTDKVAVKLNSITAGAIADAKKTLSIVTENGGLSIDYDAMKSIARQAAQIGSTDEILINVERKRNEDEAVKQTVTAALDKFLSSLSGTKDQIAAKASISEVTITVNGQPITTFDGHSLPVDVTTPSELYDAGKYYKTLVISDGGKTEEMVGRCRDWKGKRVATVRTTHLSTFVVVPVLAAAEPVKPDQPKPPTGNGEIEVRFTLLGDSIHGETDNPHTLRGGNLDTWVSQTTYTLKEGATVWDLLKKVFSDNGMTCSNPSGNYVESITWKGKTLGEFTNGKNSGWMYTLNGTHPSLGVSEQELHDGDRVVWHYTDDYTKEEGSEKWSNSGAAKPEPGAAVMQPKVTADKNGVAMAKPDADSVKEMIASAKENNQTVLAIQPDVEGTATRIGIALTKETVGMITDKSALDLDLRTKYGNIAVTNAGLKALAGTVKETLELSVEKTERGTVMAEIAVDGRRIDNVTGGVLVSLPLEGDGNVVAIIRDGKEEIIRKSVVDGKRMLLLADGSCELKIVDNRKSFNDTPNHWAKDAVDFVSSHELFNGTGANTFAPDTPMSRAMLATVLFRLEDAAADGSNPFSDVAAGTWYTDAVIWASGNKIVNGTGNGFAPDRDVTRQELVAMLYRYANSIGMDTGNTGSLDKFADRNGVADWAQEAMGWAVANGLVNGRTATTLAPEGTATRGEVAAITQRLVTLMVK